MAMIGRNAAVAEVGKHRHQVEGPIAFAAWLGVHAMLLSGAHSKTDAFLTLGLGLLRPRPRRHRRGFLGAPTHRLGRRRPGHPAHLTRPATLRRPSRNDMRPPPLHVSAENRVTASDQHVPAGRPQHHRPEPAQHDRSLWPSDSST